MADVITNIDEIVDSVNLVDKVSAKGNSYTMIQLHLENGDDINVMPPDFSTGRLLKQEVELQKLRGK